MATKDVAQPDDGRNLAIRIFLFCTRHALLRPMAAIIRFLQPHFLARKRTSELVNKLTRDPGLPCSNPTDAYWQIPPDPDLSNIQSPRLPSKVDVVIIGSGISAASISHYLITSNPNINVIICEARTITSGATGRNGGHIMDIPYDEYELEASLLGKAEAQRLARFRMEHLNELMHFAETELDEKARLASEIRVVETVDAAFDEQVWHEIQDQLEAFHRDFPDQRDKWRAWDGDEARKRFGIDHIFGAVSGPAGAIWPYRFVTAVYKNIMAKYPGRLSIETSTSVMNVDTSRQASDHPYLVHTSRGTIQCKNVVHATNGHVTHLLPRLRGKIFPIRGQMTVQGLAGPNAPPNVGDRRSWLLRHGKGYDYMTQGASDGVYYLGGGAFQGGNGGNDAIGNPADNEQDFTALCHLRGLLPMMFEKGSVESAPLASMKTSWTGTLGFSCDGRPWVGRIPTKISQRKPTFTEPATGGEWISAAFCGSGMVYCWRSGRALASMILGQKVEWFPESLLMTEERYHSVAVEDMTNYWLSMSM